MVGVAQLVEHLVVVQVVAGSSPVTHPKARRCVSAESAERVAFSICAAEVTHRRDGRMLG
jgi:hypothetical protein